MSLSPIDIKIMDLYKCNGYRSISLILGISSRSVRNRVDWLINNGFIDKTIKLNRLNTEAIVGRPLINDSELIDLYSIYGINMIAKLKGIDPKGVSRRVNKLISSGLIDANVKLSRLNYKILNKKSYRQEDFSLSIKRTAFNKIGGLCEICNLLIHKSNWRLAAYHHRKPIFEGGGRKIENCMVLHPICHINNFNELHPGLPQHVSDRLMLGLKERLHEIQET